MKKQKGSIIVFALITLSFILIAAFSVAAVTLMERRSANVSVNSATAFQNSDKGMEEFLQSVYKDLDQSNTLDDLAQVLNEIYEGAGQYTCIPSGNESIPARIGSDGSNGEEKTEFIITAFGEKSDSDNGNAGWNNNELIALDECTDSLASVARFKVVGNYSNASRAIFLKLRDSLVRGLVARWSFEDRAKMGRIVPRENERRSFIVQDISKQDHTLTLCPMRIEDKADEDPDFVEINADLGGGQAIDYKIVNFADCGSVNEESGMSPYKRNEDSDDDGEERPSGAWVDGIVEEQTGASSDIGSNSYSEAIYFDGTTHLAMYVEDGCDDDYTNCVEKGENKKEDQLQNFTKGLSISMWIKPDVVGTNQCLLSRGESDAERFNICLQDRKIAFRLGEEEVTTNDVIAENNIKWYHVVARWHKKSGHMQIWVDGVNEENGEGGAFTAPSGTLFVGSDHEGVQNFTGAIDDLYIWDRAVTNAEIWRLCTEAESNDGSNHVTTSHPGGCPQEAETLPDP
ncbi:MAG: hypothetical protein CR972_00820 [Candidatus Moraniibacteriota bacterium]|nr:MAG: hypothetical protein CR972_00820 [Candidatus Moranbacteria bacterium]